MKYLKSGSINSNYELESVEFLGECIQFEDGCFQCCHENLVISFPNAKKLIFDTNSMRYLKNGAKLKIKRGTELVGDYAKIQSRIIFIEETKISKKTSCIPKRKEEEKPEKIKSKSSTNKKKSEKEKEEAAADDDDNDSRFDKYMKRIRFLESRLRKYEEVIPFDPNSNTNDEYNNYDEQNILEINKELDSKTDNDNFIIDNDDESHQRVVNKIGEGATSITYKVIDERTDEELCKKVLKSEDGKTTFKDAQNILKEFDVLHLISHPCICKCIGLNPQENLNNNIKSKDQYDEDQTEDNPKTTIAIFLKYHPMNLRECLDRNILNNTLKTKLAIEIAFGMLHIHNNGMIHRDLKLENVMVNYIFEAQLIDFGLAHVDMMKSTMSSKTKGIGTFAYMSPEMSNEEEYDNKTDVYSYGVLLFVLFTGKFPKQSLKEKLTNIPPTFPKPSSSISSYCIDLIKKCMLFDANKRPSFDEIIDEMYDHSFKMAGGIDSEIVLNRFRMLNRFRSFKKNNDSMSKSTSHRSTKQKNKFKPTTKPIKNE